MMRFAGTRQARVVALLLILTVIAGAGVYAYRRARALYENLGPILVQQFEKQLGMPVRIGRVRANRPGLLVLEDVALGPGADGASGALATARRIEVRYGFWRFVRSGLDPAGSIAEIAVDSPWLLLSRDPAGQWNIQTFFRPKPGAKPSRFRGRVIVRNGGLTLVDYRARLATLPAVNRAAGVDGWLDFATFPQINLTAAGQVTGARGGALRASGFLDTGQGAWLITARAGIGDAAYWSRYFLTSPQIRIDAGRGDMHLTLWREARGAERPLRYTALLTGRDLVLRSPRLSAPLRDATGTLQIDPTGVSLQADARLAGIPVDVQGRLLGFQAPVLNLQVEAPMVRMAALARALPQLALVSRGPTVGGAPAALWRERQRATAVGRWREAPGAYPRSLSKALAGLGPFRLSARVLGPVNNLDISGTAKLASFTYAGQSARDISLGWRYRGGVVSLTDVRAGGAGQLRAEGWLDLRARPAQLYVAGAADRIRLSQWVKRPGLKLDGVGSGQFLVYGATNAVRGELSFEVAPLRVARASYRRAVGRVEIAGDQIQVRRLAVADPAGVVTLAGTIGPSGKLALNARASGLKLEPLLAPFTQQSAGGTAYFWGTVGGTVSRPHLDGKLQLYAARVGRYRVDFVEGPVQLTPESIASEGLVARRYPASLVVRGEIREWRTPAAAAVEATAELEDLPLGQALLALDRKEPVSGVVDARVRLEGPLRQPGISGAVQIADASVRGYDLGNVSARVRYTRHQLEVASISAGADGMFIGGRVAVGLLPGRATSQGGERSTGLVTESPISGSVVVRSVDLRRLNAELQSYATLGGDVDEIAAELGGTLGDPKVRGELRSDRLSINGVPFSGLQARLAWVDGRLRVEDGVLSAAADETGEPARGRIRILSASWPLRLAAPERATGAREGGRAVAASVGEAAVEATAQARVEEFSVGRLLRLVRNSPYLGTREGLSLLRILQRVPPSLSGNLTAELTLEPGSRSGPEAASSPRLVASVQVPELTVPAVLLRPEESEPEGSGTPPTERKPAQPLIAAVAARASFQGGFIRVEEVELTRGGATLEARGTVLLAGARSPQTGEVSQGGEVQVQVDGLNLPLRAATPFVPALYPLEGVGDLHVDVTGPAKGPRIQVSADVDNPVIAGLPFTKLSFPYLAIGGGEIRIEGARLNRTRPEGEHQVTLDGSLPFRWDPLGIPGDKPRNLQVRLVRQSLGILNDLARIERPRSPIARIARGLGQLRGVSGDVEASVTFAGTRDQPANSGDFLLHDVSFGLPSLESRIADLNVHLAFAGDQVAVQKFDGKSSSGGSFAVGGTINLGEAAARRRDQAGPLNLTLSLRDLKLKERNLSQFLNERFEGEVRTVSRSRAETPAPIRITGEFREPVIQGGFVVQNATLTLPAAIPQAPQTETEKLVDPRFDLALFVGKGTWLRNPAMRLQVTGRLPITGTLKEPNIYGRLLVERGTLTFPTARFRVNGEIEVAYNPGPAVGSGSPIATAAAPIRVDLVATSRVSGRDPNTGRARRYEITMTAQGPLAPVTDRTAEGGFGRPGSLQGTGFGQLNIQATSDPPLSPSQILALIGRQDAVKGILAGGSNVQDILREEFEQALSASVVPELFLPFETAVEQALGLSEFGLDFAFREPVQIRLGKQLVNNFYATYMRSLTGAQEQYSLELYYRISDRLRMGYRVEEPFNRRVLFLNGTTRF